MQCLSPVSDSWSLQQHVVWSQSMYHSHSFFQLDNSKFEAQCCWVNAHYGRRSLRWSVFPVRPACLKKNAFRIIIFSSLISFGQNCANLVVRLSCTNLIWSRTIRLLNQNCWDSSQILTADSGQRVLWQHCWLCFSRTSNYLHWACACSLAAWQLTLCSLVQS
jgi:hypothetical protein